MPHLRPRHLSALLKKTLAFSPIVGVFGHRQVGKTTLVQKLTDRYVSLDRREQLESSESDPASFLSHHRGSPLVIDECQLSPPLFPAMKEWVREHPEPGQLLLTGSVRFSSRKAIRESLTGRIIAWELLPMDLSETHETPLPDTLIRLMNAKTVEIDLKTAPYYSDKEFRRYLEQGGLPGIFSVREAAIRDQRFETQLETLLERDLRLLIDTTLGYRVLANLLRELAERQGLPIEIASLSRKTRISAPALRRLLNAFESLFLVRVLETRGTEKRPVLFLEDQGEASFLRGGRKDDLADLTRFLFAQLRVQHVYRPSEKTRVFQYRNRGGALVPLAYENARGAVGFIPSLTETPDASALASARSFTQAFRNAKVVVFHRGTSDLTISPAVRAVSVGKLV